MTMTTTSGAALQTRPFSSMPTLIPQLGPGGLWNGKIVKIEQVLLRGLDGGARLHLWIEPDPRPHNHPWEWIDCKVLRGSYVAREYLPQTFSGYVEQTCTLRAGDPEHRVTHKTHHQITDVQPGTISVMSFGPVVGDGKQWGHLKKEDGVYVFELAQPMGSFVDALRHCNPHLRPAGWANPYSDQLRPAPDMSALLALAGL